MDVQSCQLTVYFEEPFWVGLFERKDDGKLFVYKYVFGAEPKDYDILALINTQFEHFQFSSVHAEIEKQQKKVSFKKMQKKINRTLKSSNRTKSQQVMQEQHEQNKLVRKKRSKAELKKIKQYKFDLKQAKRKQKHRGH